MPLDSSSILHRLAPSPRSLLAAAWLGLTACCQTPTADPEAGAHDAPRTSPGSRQDPGSETSTCARACAHRTSCGLPSTTACAEECASIQHVFVGNKLTEYASATCSQVKQEESFYANAVRCARGCDRRVECLHVSDRDACVSDCSMAGLRPDHLDEYARLSCREVEAREADHQELRQMIHTCKRLLECEVPGEMIGCLQLARKNLTSKVYGIDKLAALEKESCDTLRKTTYIIPPRTGGGAVAGGGAYVPQGSNGWFGSWVDTRGRVVTHRPPPPGSF